MSVKVIDLNETAPKVEDELPAVETIEEEPKGAPVETPEIANEVVEEGNEHVNEEVKVEEVKPKAKPKPKPKASDLVFCPDCSRQMTYKNLRYSHKCHPEPPPVKKHTNPKSKAKPKQAPKPPPQTYYSSSDEEEVLQQPLIKKKQQKQPPNPLLDITNQYALLHQQLMQQRQDKYNKVCAGMFAPRVKKRW